MRHLNSTTRLFVILLIVTLVLTYLGLILSRQQLYNDVVQSAASEMNNSPAKTPAEKPVALVSTTDWVKYEDGQYPITFLHPKNWLVTTDTKRIKNQYSIVINPPQTNKNIYIYVSDDDYLALGGLQKKPYRIANADGVKVVDVLVGAKTGDYYFTFDATLNEPEANEFTTLLSTVQFN